MGLADHVVYIGYSSAPIPYQAQFFNLKELDIMGLHNATMQDFVNVTAHLGKIADTADLLISRVFLFNKAEAALPYRDGNRNALKIIIERD